MSDKDDCISKKMAIDTIMGQPPEPHYPSWYAAQIEKLPAAQPDHNADIGKKVEGDTISRQAAIDALARMMPRSYTPDGSHPADEEIFRAQEIFADCIEALEILPSAQPATNCSEIPNGSDDTISRQAAIEALRKCQTYLFDECDPDKKIELRSAERAIEDLPSAQPEERKKGAWILGFDNQYLEKYYFCSKCGSRKYMEDKPLDNFCPNCGADMRGEQDG